MASSISSSEFVVRSRGYIRPARTMGIVFLLLLAGLEIATRAGFTYISRIESRTRADYRSAIAVRPGGPGRESVLMLGNSLLLEGLDYDAMRRLMAPRAEPVRFVIERTDYLDWYYGIRRLIDDGAQPDRVVLCLNLVQLVSPHIRGDYSAFYLVSTPDLIAAGREAGLDFTGISQLFFGRYSMFYAGRNNLRNFILNRTQLEYARTLQGFASLPHDPDAAQIRSIVTARLVRLREFCAAHKVRFQLLYPPAFGSGNAALLEAGRNAGVEVLIPVPENAWGQEMFRDGFHLNQQGAAQFTEVLAAALRQ